MRNTAEQLSRCDEARILRRSALPSDTADLARFLLGKLVVRELPEGVLSGRIVETEAYVVGDAANHANRGMTPRNRSMFLESGYAYVYLAYGVCFMLNVVSEEDGRGTAVLIRALEPLQGVAVMQTNRGTVKLRDLTRGPGRLTQALRIARALDGIDLCAPGEIWLADDGHPACEPGVSVRIGITKDAHLPLRFYMRGNAFVSGPRLLNA